MTPFSEQIITSLEKIHELYHRLVLLVAPTGHGKTQVLSKISAQTDVNIINVNLRLSTRLLDFDEKSRRMTTPKLFEYLVLKTEGDVAILDNLEILFSPEINLNPLNLLMQVSRNKTIVATWNGNLEKGNLIYARPSHPEYRKYKEDEIKDIIIVNAQT